MFHQKFNNDDKVQQQFSAEEHENWITRRKLFRNKIFVEEHDLKDVI